MRGAPGRAIQALAGHSHVTMTQRYMHLSPAALDDAIRLLELRPRNAVGDMMETREDARDDEGVNPIGRMG